MLERARDLLRRRFVRGLAVSLVLHVLVVALALTLAVPAARYNVKRGEPLFVELPELPEPAPRGNPAAKSLSAARPAPPAARPSPPAPRPAPPGQPSDPVEKPPAPPAPSPAAAAPPVVASRPAAPPAPEPPSAEDGSLTVPAPKPEPAVPESPQPPPSASGGEPRPAAGPLVAAVPPSPPAPPPVDIRSALARGGGAGSVHGGGRGGIEGEPIPLDSSDPNFDDFLDRVRRQIKANWGYPCIRADSGPQCDYKSTQLVVVFGILKAGRVQFVEVHRSSGFQIYDDYAVNAIKLGSPFPPVPKGLMARMKPGSTGAAIVATFNYALFDTTLTNILR